MTDDPGQLPDEELDATLADAEPEALDRDPTTDAGQPEPEGGAQP